MPNNRHRQIEKFRKAELLRARREFEAKGYDWDKTVEAFQKLGEVIIKEIIPDIEKSAESINRAINNACVEFSKAAGTIAEAIRKVQE